jgi:predicted acyltransferase
MTNATTLKRNDILDALRGIAILLMILSGSIAFGGILPAWMYHAQVPPPLHIFNPALPGITWVDLVFPFFLFSMGVAIPLSIGKWEGKENATAHVWWIAIRRYLLLTWFALFVYHMKAWVMAEQPTAIHYLISIGAFVLFFLELYQPVKDANKKIFVAIRIAAFAVSTYLLFSLPFNKGQGFMLEKSDIIIIVLANMAFFGTVTWWHTRHNPWFRIGILPFIMAIFLGGKMQGSINEFILNATVLPWMYKFYYLKYLFIIIPGTIVGEDMLRQNDEGLPKNVHFITGLLLFAIIIVNVCFLYSRMLMVNMGVTIAMLISIFLLLKNYRNTLAYHLFSLGSYLLLLGLFFESYEGGIKKDSSTFSYYFVTTGLAIYMLSFFYSWQHTSVGAAINRYLATNGKNPMVAYVAGGLLLTPILYLTGGQALMDWMNGNAFTGFLKGVIYTGIISLITFGFTRYKWFWKT